MKSFQKAECKSILFALFFLSFLFACNPKLGNEINTLKAGFVNPPDSSRPGVYWYFMDGNMSETGMTADLESMKRVGIGSVVFLEVNVGIPKGPVDFLSDEWQGLFVHAVHECERLGIEMTLGVGPGWTGSGGPWISPGQSMQYLVSSATQVTAANKNITLAVPPPRKPYFGEGSFTPELKKQWSDFYEDVAVLAFPTPSKNNSITDIDEKALYYRAPFSSVKGVRQYLPSVKSYPELPAGSYIAQKEIIDLTSYLKGDTLKWSPPAGNWTIMRFGRRNNGAVTRPAPIQGLGFEADKFDTVALNWHFEHYIGKLIKKIQPQNTKASGGLKMLHMDSWEMGAQNWTPKFREEFIKRRGYDPQPFYPVYVGRIVENTEISERFLWDLRQTSQELVLEYHAGHIKKYSHKNGFGLSIEPYDMNPTADLELGAVADVPMCEFWSKAFGFNTSFASIEATSIAHINGNAVVPAEAFTAEGKEGFQQYPGSMKEQGDWAFAAGINKFVYHTFQHQSLDEKLRPGMTMGPYGVHWDRNQTWWPLAGAYHRYISRCQYLLQQGRTVADILYLTPEGAPHVFRPPLSALEGDAYLPDRKGYNFDGCAPSQLYKAKVKNNRIIFRGGASYRLLVLPFSYTMTPGLLAKVSALIKAGAIVIGLPPIKSPGLSGYPQCDQKIASMVKETWGSNEIPTVQSVHPFGKGKIIWGGDIAFTNDSTLYPAYEITAKILEQMNVPVDFASAGQVRYTHRTTSEWDLYFIANRTEKDVKTDCSFKTTKGTPQLWDPMTGEIRNLPEFTKNNFHTTIPFKFSPFQSFFVVFTKNKTGEHPARENFPDNKVLTTLGGSWAVSFDPKWGGPEKIIFEELQDWTSRPEKGIKYYSGTAVYSKSFELPQSTFINIKNKRIFLDLGEVKNMASVTLNNRDAGVVWASNKLDITDMVNKEENKLAIEIVNLWPNRLIGDQKLPDDGIKDGKWPEWLLKGAKRTSGRFTFVTYHHYKADAPLLKSGLLGPVKIIIEERK